MPELKPTLTDLFAAPFWVQEVHPQGKDKPAIYVLRDDATSSLGGFEKREIADVVCAALNDYCAFDKAMKADPGLMRRFVTVIARENRSAKGDV